MPTIVFRLQLTEAEVVKGIKEAGKSVPLTVSILLLDGHRWIQLFAKTLPSLPV